jgi:hypothetical protein
MSGSHVARAEAGRKAVRTFLLAVLLMTIPVGLSFGQPAPQLPRDQEPGPQAAVYRSDRLGIEYQLKPYRGHSGVKLTRSPAAGSPFLRVQRPSGEVIYLEPGDLIVRLDDQVIDGPSDLEAHIRETRVEIVNVRNGLVERLTATFPAT